MASHTNSSIVFQDGCDMVSGGARPLNFEPPEMRAAPAAPGDKIAIASLRSWAATALAANFDDEVVSIEAGMRKSTEATDAPVNLNASQ